MIGGIGKLNVCPIEWWCGVYKVNCMAVQEGRLKEPTKEMELPKEIEAGKGMAGDVLGDFDFSRSDKLYVLRIPRYVMEEGVVFY